VIFQEHVAAISVDALILGEANAKDAVPGPIGVGIDVNAYPARLLVRWSSPLYIQTYSS
jgi:hypothetical protein